MRILVLTCVMVGFPMFAGCGKDGGGDSTADTEADADTDADSDADADADADADTDADSDTDTDTEPETCTSCHGAGDNPAPPPDVAGSSDTSHTSVGAHATHVAADVACAECHVVPTAVGDAGHIDASPAEVTFGTLASDDGVTPSWDGSTCTVYCHGASLSAGSNTTPNWTTVNGTQAACGTCHGTPPGGSHPSQTDCESCHGQVAGANMTIINDAKHGDGTVEFN
jgi:predicted CxxxxCH...CXXCH cytochrome family protein